MSEVVDTRIVEAKFDSKQFEKGVDKTVKKLDELKKSLNLEDTGKSIADLASKATDAADKATSSLEKLENRITSFTGMLKQKLLGGIADEVVGVFFKIKNGFESLVNSLGSVQVSRGMERYTDMLTSVRTMVANGTQENLAYEMIERLNLYADQTSYSIDQLVNLMSQLKTGGANIKQAEKMVEGLSNAAAASGVNAQRAATAYYNFAQAYQKGAMLQQDWMSFQNIGMSGVKMNQAILDAAEAVGTLKKEANGTYRTINKLDKQIKTTGSDAKGITAENMGQKLSSRWFNKAVMEKFTADMYYFAEIDPDELKKYTDLERLIKEGKEDAKALDNLLKENGLTRFAYDAFRAGQEARSFTDVMNTLKDVISRGWSKSFEYLFGKLDEAKDFFTELTEGHLANAIYSIGTFRNEILRNWSQSGGRDDLIGAIRNIDEALGEVLEQFTIFSGEGKDFESVTKRLGDWLSAASFKLRGLTQSFLDWLRATDPKSGKTNAEKIADAFEKAAMVIGGALRVLQTSFRVAKGVFSVVLPIIGQIFEMLEPVFDAFNENIQKVVDNVSELFDPNKVSKTDGPYVKLQQLMQNILKVADPVVKVLPKVINILGDIATFFVNIAAGTFLTNLQFVADLLGLIIELFGGESAQKAADGDGVLGGIKKDVEKLARACSEALVAISEFFSAVIKDLRKILGLDKETGEDGGFFDNIANFFKTNEFVQNVRKWFRELPGKIWSAFKTAWVSIKKLGKNIWKAVDEFLFGKKVIETVDTGKENGKKRYQEIERRVTKGFVDWLKDVIGSVWNWITTIPSQVRELWQKIVDQFYSNVVLNGANPSDSDATATVSEKIFAVFSAVWGKVREKVEKWFATIKGFITNLWQSIVDYFYSKTVLNGVKVEDSEGNTHTTAEKVVAVFKSLYEEIKSRVTEFAKTVKSKSGEIWRNLVYAIFGKDGFNQAYYDAMKNRGHGDAAENFKKLWEENNPAGQIVLDTFTDLWSNISGSVSKWITETLPNTFTDLWTKAVNYLYSKTVLDGVNVEDTEGNAKSLREKSLAVFSTWYENLKTDVQKWSKKVGDTAGNVWQNVVYAVFGRSGFDQQMYDNISRFDTRAANQYKETWEKENPASKVVLDSFTEWWRTTYETVKSWLTTDLPNKVKALWKEVVDFVLGKEIGTGEVITVENQVTGTKQTIELTERVKEGFSLWLDNTCESVRTWLGKTKNTVKVLWNDLLTMIFGGEGKFDQQMYDNISRFDTRAANQYKETWRKEHPLMALVSDIDGMLKSAGISIGKVFSNLPSYIAEGINFKAGLLDNALKKFTEYLNGKNAEDGLIDVKDIISENAEEAKEASENGEGNHKFLEAVLSIGQTLYDMVTKTIPPLVSAAWTRVKGKSSEWVGIVSNFFKDNGISWETINEDIVNIADKIREKIEGIPDMVRGAVSTVQSLFKKPVQKTTYTIFDEFDNIVQEGLSTDELDSFLRSYKGKVSKIAQKVEETTEDSDLWKTIKGIGSSIGKAIIDFGPDMLNFGSELLGKANAWIMNFSQEMTERDKSIPFAKWVIDQFTDDADTANAIYESLKGFGETLITFITETIPGFIEAGIREVIIGLPKIINRIFNKEKPVAEAAESVANNVASGADNAVNEITEALSESREALVRNIVGMSSGDNEYTLDSIFGDGFSSLLGISSKMNEDASEFSDGAVSAAETFQKAIDQTKKAEEEAIDDGLTWAERRDKKLKELKGEESRLRSWISNYGLDYRLSSNTKERQAYIEQNANLDRTLRQIDYLNSLNEGDSLDLSWFDEAKSEDFIDNAKSFMQNVVDIFKGIGENDTVKVVAVCVAVMYALSAIRDTLSVADELEAPGYTAKWVAIGIAMAGIFGILGWITYLSGREDANLENGRLAKTMETLDKVAQFIKDIVGAITTISGILAGKSVFDWLESLTGKGSGFFGTLAKVALGILAPKAIGASIEKMFEGLGGTFTRIGESVDSFMDYIGPTIDKLVDASDKIEKAISAIEGIKTILSKFNDLINHVGIDGLTSNEDFIDLINTNVVWKDTTGSDIRVVMNDSANRKAEDFIKVFVENLEGRMLFIYQLSAMLNNLGDAFKTLEEVEDVKAQIKKLSEIFDDEETVGELNTFVMNMFGIIYGNIQKLGGGSSKIDISQAAVGFQMLSDALSVFGTGIKDLNTENVTALSQVFDVFKSLAEAFGKADDGQTYLERFIFGTNNLATFGEQIKLFGGYIKSFFQNVKEGIDVSNSNEIGQMQQRIDFVLQVAQGMAEAVNALGSQGAVELLDSLGQKIGSDVAGRNLSKNIGTFIHYVNEALGEDIDLERVQIVATGLQSISELMQGVAAMVFNFRDPHDIPAYIDNFLKGLAESFLKENNLFTAGQEAGKNLDLGLAAGIGSGKAKLAMMQLAEELSGAFTVYFQIGSPSKLMEEFGRYLDEGLAIGMDKDSDAPIAAAQELAEDVQNEIQSILDNPNLSQRTKDSLILDILKRNSEQDRSEINAIATDDIDAYWDSVERYNRYRKDEFGYFMTDKDFLNNFFVSTRSGYEKAAQRIGEGIGEHIVLPITKAAKYLTEMYGEYAPEADDVITRIGKIYNSFTHLQEVVNTGFSIGFDFDDATKTVKPHLNTPEIRETAIAILTDIQEVFGECMPDYANNLVALGIEAINGNLAGGAAMGRLSEIGRQFLGSLGEHLTGENEQLAIKAMDTILASMEGEAGNGGVRMVTALFGVIKEVSPDLFRMLGKGLMSEVGDGMAEGTEDVQKTNLIAALQEMFAEDFNFTPKVTPVLEITDDFKMKAAQISTLIGSGAITPSLDTDVTSPFTSASIASQILAPGQTESERQMSEIVQMVRTASANTKDFNENLAKMKFIITGKDFSYVVGPNIDEYLGSEGVYVARR